MRKRAGHTGKARKTHNYRWRGGERQTDDKESQTDRNRKEEADKHGDAA